MKKSKSVGTPKNRRVRKGVLSKRGTLGVDKLKKQPCYLSREGRVAIDPAWGSDVLERLKELEEVFRYLGVDPSYYKSHLYYLRETVHELLDHDGVWGG